MRDSEFISKRILFVRELTKNRWDPWRTIRERNNGVHWGLFCARNEIWLYCSLEICRKPPYPVYSGKYLRVHNYAREACKHTKRCVSLLREHSLIPRNATPEIFLSTIDYYIIYVHSRCVIHDRIIISSKYAHFCYL